MGGSPGPRDYPSRAPVDEYTPILPATTG